MRPTEFYLASSEGYDLDEPRRCTVVASLRTPHRDDLLLIRIDPPLVGQDFGLGGRDLDLVVIAPRHRGETLHPITRWPVFVHVARLLVAYEGQKTIGNDDLDAFAWAEIYETEDAARSKSG